MTAGFRKLGVLSAAVATCSLLAAAPALAQGVKIGVLNDQSGVYADYGGKSSIEAAKMAVEDFGGEVLGHKIEIVSADHQNKPDLAVSIARKWYDTEGVDMITELTTSSVALAVQELTKEKKKIDIVVGAASSAITGASCSPYGFHWAFDTHALAVGTGGAMVKAGGDSWFFLTVDYAFGHALEKDTSEIVKASGGKVLGAVRTPLNTSDYSSFLLQAQGSKADVVGLATSGADVQTAIKQAGEFGIVEGGQKLAGLLVFITDVNSLGLKVTQGLQVTTSFYWDLNDQTRAWSKRYAGLMDGKVASMVQAGVYSGVHHYLAAVKAAGTTDATAVAAKMHELKVNDMYNKDVVIRPDGRVLHTMHLVQVKKPEESKYKYDYYRVVSSKPGEEVFRPMSEGGCPLVK